MKDKIQIIIRIMGLILDNMDRTYDMNKLILQIAKYDYCAAKLDKELNNANK